MGIDYFSISYVQFVIEDYLEPHVLLVLMVLLKIEDTTQLKKAISSDTLADSYGPWWLIPFKLLDLTWSPLTLESILDTPKYCYAVDDS